MLQHHWLDCIRRMLYRYFEDIGHPIMHLFHRIEFQQRGTLHSHILLWIANAPQPLDWNEEDTTRWADLLNKLISADHNNLGPELQWLQTHEHYDQCYKHNQLQCKFPKLPSAHTRIILPLPCSETEQEYSSSQILGRCHSFLIWLQNLMMYYNLNQTPDTRRLSCTWSPKTT
eukprot:Blabericola_migrator_1__7771@NODE_3977_length_1399_cov_2_317568_g2451_i0_p1_GENE_NODE_3977_length_1399_cov_2_317568_g2451_i0NODE_3977_length_1399_cov_2_317568_g2451_i0_p1_ORF_typecomplete_len173_score10_72Helitron_like_N/PF14214_6/0_0011Questin_oxidase/PF14027_6/0_0053_NODE_3977_length_1399_cov_2_317568_g2451_i04861004